MAKDFDRTDYWAPDSSLHSEAPGIDYELSDGTFVNVQVNDWLDLDPNGVPDDPFWGSSKQVISLEESSITIRMYNAELDLFEPASISPVWILDNFRRVPKN